MIYADNAATTQLDMEAFDSMKYYLIDDYANSSQPYSFSRNAKKTLEDSRKIIAECIGADSKEIYFTSGGSESDNWAIKMGAERGKHIITSAIEHHAVLNACCSMERRGKKISYLPVTEDGTVCADVLRGLLSNDTGIVSVMYANNEVGSIQPISELVKMAHSKKVLFHTDAVQAVGHLKINVHELGVDMLSASAHKFNGPKGIGFLYIKKGTEIKPYIDGGSQEGGLRAGTENIASIVAMAIALKNNCIDMEKNSQYISGLEKKFIDELNESGLDYRINGSAEKIPGNISLSFGHLEGEMLLHRLDLQGICVSTGSACDSKNTQISHVLKAMGIDSRYAKGTIRISLGKYNTSQEMVSIVRALNKIIKK